MGKRLRVVKEQEKYGSSERFNWKYNEFADLLSALDCNVCYENEYDKERFEVPTCDFEIAMEYVKEIKEGKTDFEDIDVNDLNFEELGGIDVVLDAMEVFYEERDKKASWMIFVAW